MDFLLSKYGVIFTEFDSIDRGEAEVNNVKFSKYHTISHHIYLLSKMSITVLLHSEKIYKLHVYSNV